MTNYVAKASPLFYARAAGILYLLLVPLGIFGILYVPSTLVVSGDAAVTISNIMANEMLFRLSIVSALLVPIVNLFVVLYLYRLLKPVNRNQAALMAIFLLLAIPKSSPGSSVNPSKSIKLR